MRLPTLDAVDAHLGAAKLSEFVRLAWPVIQPEPFRSNWHIDVVCEHLEAATKREIRRLIINVPPRTGKSRTISVLWPAWVWLARPETRFMFASYAADLATEHSVECRDLIESRGGRLEGGTVFERIGYAGVLKLLAKDWEIATDKNLKTRFQNTEHGYRMATSTRAKATGFGGDIIVADDPHNAMEAESDIEREKVLRWWDAAMSSRMNDPNTGVRVVVMQRLNEADLTGHLLEKEAGYTHLCLPMEYERTHPFVCPAHIQLPDWQRPVKDDEDRVVLDDRGEPATTTVPGRVIDGDPRTDEGQLLWPGRIAGEALEQMKTDMGSYTAAGQLQQRPAPAEGGIFKTAWWRYYDNALLDELDELLRSGVYDPGKAWHGPHFTRLWQSWDTSFKEKTDSDYVVGGLWGQDLGNRYLLRKVRARMGLTDAIQAVRDMTAWAKERFPALSCAIFIENTANGPEVRAALRHQVQGMIPVDVDRDKVSRAYAITPQIEAGNVYLPGAAVMGASGWEPDRGRTKAWVQELINECAAFPNAAHDDQVDMLTQALDPRRLTGEKRPKSERARKPSRWTAGGR